jgi:hypothetical protein
MLGAIKRSFIIFLATQGIALVALSSETRADPVNLLLNNSFESDGGNSTGLICPMSDWSGCLGINAGETSTLDPILVGHYEYLAIGTVGQLGFVSQTIPTVVGQTYQFTFVFSSDGAIGNSFEALWNGNVVMSATNTPFNPDWTDEGTMATDGAIYSFLETATSTSTTVAFGGEGNGSSYIGVDDMDVFATNVILPVVVVPGKGSDYKYSFDIDGVISGVLFYIDPAFASGYIYQIGAGDPNFACVTLPAVQSTPFTVSFAEGASTISDPVSANNQFCFPTGGVSEFEVTGIDPTDDLDPSDPTAFVTGLSLVGDGSFTGTMTALVGSVPEPGTLTLFASGLLGLGWLRRRKPR